MLKLTIGITIYNRKDTLEKMIKSLFASELCNDCIEYAVRVYDDCSSEFSEKEVRAMFPVEIDYYRHVKNRGSDYNIGFMYRSFLEKGDDILLNADSDLIFDTGWLDAVLKYLPKTDGILSLFNSISHPCKMNESELCIKETIGSAGTLMTRAAVEAICDSIKEEEMINSLDWNWCGLFNKQGKKIYCTSRSYVQHIGFHGFNSSSGRMDIGDDFSVNNLVNGQILGDVLHDMITYNNSHGSELRSFYYLFPFDKIPYGKKVVLYGNGVVGQDYARQLEADDYCDELIRIDKNHDIFSNVFKPEILMNIDCDYVVIAVNLLTVREEIRNEILKLNPSLIEKIVDVPTRIIRL